ncbi:MAG: S1/P1 Nuclease [Bacteroidetes bacterium]|nr:S1/P1 Nuclease [Bacteroidota bacterium]MBL0032013.1 S1/P1 Nuclease [Bacteroidota bacterium]MBP6427097.1 S1/P1 Nuclease [Bacteroidia bacterium]MBP6658838.1 S1/P1 Nuclease [Bacteroidia bacterium]
MKQLFAFTLLILGCINSFGWGFYGHRAVNKFACFALPKEMFGFYKSNIDYLINHSIDPDKRRHSDPAEAPRHFIDADHYGENPFDTLPIYWKDAVEKFTEDTLQAYGIGPWYINKMFYRLVEAFRKNDPDAILYYSANIGHYIADSHVPLHCTENYNGQMTNQHGIHGLWESRLPELFASNYDYFMGRCQYIEKIQPFIWLAVHDSYAALDSVLAFEKLLTENSESDKKYSFEQRGSTTIQVYSYYFSEQFHHMLNGQVERRLQASIIDVASIWYTAWVEAGMPELIPVMIEDEKKEEIQDGDYH